MRLWREFGPIGRWRLGGGKLLVPSRLFGCALSTNCGARQPDIHIHAVQMDTLRYMHLTHCCYHVLNAPVPSNNTNPSHLHTRSYLLSAATRLDQERKARKAEPVLTTVSEPQKALIKGARPYARLAI